MCAQYLVSYATRRTSTGKHWERRVPAARLVDKDKEVPCDVGGRPISGWVSTARTDAPSSGVCNRAPALATAEKSAPKTVKYPGRRGQLAGWRWRLIATTVCLAGFSSPCAASRRLMNPFGLGARDRWPRNKPSFAGRCGASASWPFFLSVLVAASSAGAKPLIEFRLVIGVLALFALSLDPATCFELSVVTFR